MDEKPELWAPLNSFIKMHTSYQSVFKEAINMLFYDDGPLPFYCRHYLAIMAASRHKCQYLMKIHREEFLRHTGPPNWLDGLEHTSQKIRDLDLTNRLLAHRPWLLQVSHLKTLSSSPNNWSLSEMVQGALILSHTHALCSLVSGCGLYGHVGRPLSSVLKGCNNFNGEISTNCKLHDCDRSSKRSLPTPNGNSRSQRTSLTPSTIASVKGTRRIAVSPLRRASASATMASRENSVKLPPLAPNSAPADPAKMCNEKNEKSQLAKCKSFEAGRSNNGDNVEKLKACMQVLTEAANRRTREDMLNNFLAVNQQNCEINADCPKDGENCSVVSYTNDSEFTYSEFFRKTDGLAPPIFSIHEYSWSDHGYSVVSELYNQISDVMDEKFKCIQDLTYHCMGGHKNVDTTKYRTAVWNYIQTLFGIRHDDYDYSEINKLLSRPVKSYIKTLCCYPERMKSSLRDNVMLDFLQSEKIHVNLLIFEARFHAEILYLLRAVLRFLT